MPNGYPEAYPNSGEPGLYVNVVNLPPEPPFITEVQQTPVPSVAPKNWWKRSLAYVSLLVNFTVICSLVTATPDDAVVSSAVARWERAISRKVPSFKIGRTGCGPVFPLMGGSVACFDKKTSTISFTLLYREPWIVPWSHCDHEDVVMHEIGHLFGIASYKRYPHGPDLRYRSPQNPGYRTGIGKDAPRAQMNSFPPKDGNAMNQEFQKGDRVRLSQKALDAWPNADPKKRGTLTTGKLTPRGSYRVVWDGTKEPHSYNPSFIEKDIPEPQDSGASATVSTSGGDQKAAADQGGVVGNKKP